MNNLKNKRKQAQSSDSDEEKAIAQPTPEPETAPVVSEEPAEWQLDKLIIQFTASDEIRKKKDIAYLKYRLQYNAKKDFDGHFDCKTPDKEFVHEVKGSVQEKMLWLKEMHLRKVKLSLKKEKKLLSNKVLGTTEHPLRDLTRHNPYEEGVVFDEGNVTFKVSVVASKVDAGAAKVPEKKASFFDKSLGVVSFGKLGAKDEDVKKVEVEKVEIAVAEVAAVEEIVKIEEVVAEEVELIEEVEKVEEEVAELVEEMVEEEVLAEEQEKEEEEEVALMEEEEKIEEVVAEVV